MNEFGVMRWEPGAAKFMDDQMDLFEQRGMNYALWVWAPSWKPMAEEDAFNFRHGPDPDCHTDVATSELMDVILKYWKRNMVRPSPVEEVTQDGLPGEFALGQNYPNPFNSYTAIEFSVPRKEFVVLRVFDLLGEEVATLVAGEFPPGRYRAVWNPGRSASGVYCCRLEAGHVVRTRKFVLVR